MNCAHCGAWSWVKQTRGDRRRRECANGHRFTTVEVLAAAVDEEASRVQRAARVREARKVLREKGYLR